MDCDMPVMNGFTATNYILKYANEQIKNENNTQFKIPIIAAITGDSS